MATVRVFQSSPTRLFGSWNTEDMVFSVLGYNLVEPYKDKLEIPALFNPQLNIFDWESCQVAACIATACKKSDSSSHCRSKLMDFWSHPQVKKCWETKQ